MRKAFCCMGSNIHAFKRIVKNFPRINFVGHSYFLRFYQYLHRNEGLENIYLKKGKKGMLYLFYCRKRLYVSVNVHHDK